MSEASMRRALAGIILAIHMTILVSGCGGPDEPAARRPVERPATYQGTIIAMGDSLTEGLGVEESLAYPARLEEKLAAAGYPFRVINAGISAETSSGALSRINWVLTLKPDIVILETGANDGLRGIAPALTEQNIDRIVGILKQNQVTVVLAGMKMMRNLGRDYTQAFAKTFENVAEKHNLIFIPFFLAGVAADPSLNQPDGIHPTAEGYRIITDRVFPYIVKAIERVSAK